MIKLLAKNAWLRRGIYLSMIIIAILPMFYGLTNYSIEKINDVLIKHPEIQGIVFYYMYVQSIFGLILILVFIRIFSIFRDEFSWDN